MSQIVFSYVLQSFAALNMLTSVWIASTAESPFLFLDLLNFAINLGLFIWQGAMRRWVRTRHAMMAAQRARARYDRH